MVCTAGSYGSLPLRRRRNRNVCNSSLNAIWRRIWPIYQRFATGAAIEEQPEQEGVLARLQAASGGDRRRADAQDARLDAWITTGAPENPVFNDGKDASASRYISRLTFVKLAVGQTQALLLPGMQVQPGLDCRNDFRGKSSQIVHFSEIIADLAEVGVGNRQKQGADRGLVGYGLRCRTCWHHQFLLEC